MQIIGSDVQPQMISGVGDALWLFLALPQWYVEFALLGTELGLLTEIPAVGMIFLVAGAAFIFWKRDWRLLIFLSSIGASQVYVTLAGLFRGIPSNNVITAALYTFLALQLLLVGFLVYRLRSAWPGASALALFSLAYASLAMFISAMAFSDTWL